DLEAALNQVDGDRELLLEIIGLYFEERSGLMAGVQHSIERRDSDALERAAHKLKGSVGNFEARPAYEAAYRLEALGRQREWTDIDTGWAALESEIARLDHALTAFQEENR